ncbi:hypothetical protein ACFYOK_01745 [Microbispora bryophytorum]|uniref:hypothetical protein n=1 Tax=Microbispora bryophytorum TaxID=1460882 RepID=UPI0033EF7A99
MRDDLAAAPARQRRGLVEAGVPVTSPSTSQRSSPLTDGASSGATGQRSTSTRSAAPSSIAASASMRTALV